MTTAVAWGGALWVRSWAWAEDVTSTARTISRRARRGRGEEAERAGVLVAWRLIYVLLFALRSRRAMRETALRLVAAAISGAGEFGVVAALDEVDVVALQHAAALVGGTPFAAGLVAGAS